MRRFFSQHSTATLWSVALHVVIAGALTLGIGLPRPSKPAGQLAIQAVVVDTGALEQEQKRQEAAKQAEARAERERVAALERERKAKEEAAERARQEAERKRQEEAKRKAEEAAALAAKQEAERKAAEEAKRKAAAEAKRKADEAAALAAKQEAERKAAEEAKRKAAEEAKRKAEEEAKRAAEAERRRKEAEQTAREQAELEADLQRQLAAEQARMDARRSGLEDEYIRLITNRIEQNWIRPPGAQSGLDCLVKVTQIPSGEVVNVTVGQCNGDEAVVRSIEAAVLKASPLPLPPVQALFERNLNIRFVPDD